MSSSASRKKISVASLVSARSSFSCSSYAVPCESAFWKIVGFEVTPVTASSFIIRASSPLETRSRESVSNQTDWPRAATWWSLDSGIEHPSLHLRNFYESRDVTIASVELRREERGHEVGGEARADHFGAEAEHVHVVVLDALVRGVDVMADRCADPG